MKNQALFPSKDRSKKLKCRLLQFLFGALKVKTKTKMQVNGNNMHMYMYSHSFHKDRIVTGHTSDYSILMERMRVHLLINSGLSGLVYFYHFIQF